ncbi:MAG: hypothetical protein J3K34DRAFT_471694 [Monoraphidium minutum]|nr:MAG: hypothetical protein J3K34DRAFT_471694 [Monoraphidium minutum]
MRTCACAPPSAPTLAVFEFRSPTAAKVLVIGRTANIKVFPNRTSSAYLTLKFGRVEEQDQVGKAVYGHSVQSLAGLTPTYSTGLRTSGDTDYTYVKMVFDGSSLKLPDCPTEEELVKLGLAPTAADKAAAAAAAKKGRAGAGGAAAGAAAGQQLLPESQPVHTLGDSRLAATIAALTSFTADPPPRPEAMMGARRRLAQAGAGAPGGLARVSKLVAYSRAPLREMPSVVGAVIGDNGLTKDGRDPFAELITKPPRGGGGSVSVITGNSFTPESGRSAQGGGAPTITLTFFFGMTANKTFAYGKGNSIQVPADGVKFNIEATNWPFCSPLNSLKFDIAVATNMAAAAQAQLTPDPEAVQEPSGMITDMYAGPTRHLMQPGDISGAFLDIESATALALASAGRAPKLPTRTAKLLISTSRAASLECATVAYPSVGSAINSSVAVALTTSSSAAASPDARSSKIANATVAAVSSANANALGGSKLSLTFPYFETLYYDPVISFGSIDGMAVDDLAPASNCTGPSCGRGAERRANGAGGRLGRAAAAAAAGAAAAAALLLW